MQLRLSERLQDEARATNADAASEIAWKKYEAEGSAYGHALDCARIVERAVVISNEDSKSLHALDAARRATLDAAKAAAKAQSAATQAHEHSLPHFRHSPDCIAPEPTAEYQSRLL